MKRYEESQKQKALDLLAEGNSYREVSEKVKAPPSTIKGWLVSKEQKEKKKRVKIKGKSSRKPATVFDPALKAQVVAAVQEGNTIKEAADAHGVRYHLAYSWCHKAKKVGGGGRKVKVMGKERIIKAKVKAKVATIKIPKSSPLPLPKVNEKTKESESMKLIVLEAQNEYLKKMLELHGVEI